MSTLSKKMLLFEAQGGHCYYCNCEMDPTKIHGGKPPSNSLTIEHIHDRFDPIRLDPNYAPVLVAACYSCNNSRARRRNKIFKGESKIRSTLGSKSKKKLKTYLENYRLQNIPEVIRSKIINGGDLVPFQPEACSHETTSSRTTGGTPESSDQSLVVVPT